MFKPKHFPKNNGFHSTSTQFFSTQENDESNVSVGFVMLHALCCFSSNTGFSDGLFVMTTATDHKNNLNRSTIKKNFPRTLRVETIANSAGGTAAVAMVAQPSTGFLNGQFLSDGSPTEDTEDCLGRITVGLTRSKSLTIIVFPTRHDGVDWNGASTGNIGIWY